MTQGSHRGILDGQSVFAEGAPHGAIFPCSLLAQGVPRVDDRTVVSGILYVIRYGCGKKIPRKSKDLTRPCMIALRAEDLCRSKRQGTPPHKMDKIAFSVCAVAKGSETYEVLPDVVTAEAFLPLTVLIPSVLLARR